jgi:isoleucyl-tRNA synthetase
MLTAVATRGRAPFKTVLTHGFVNDKSGKKMSKSKGNVTSPLDLMKTHGAEILRLWVILEDYRNDVNFSMESLERVSETYRKIRNTIRFMLGNLYDFAPDTDLVALDKMGELDRWALSRAASVLEKVEKAYESYEFHQVYHLITNLCVVDLSALYFDILKDRLYTAGKKSPERRSSQTAMWLITDVLIRVLAPVLSFTSEEILGFMPASQRKPESVFLSEYPSYARTLSKWSDAQLEENFSGIWAIRDVALKSLEEARQAKTIGHPREARVTLTVDPASDKALQATKEDLGRLFLVSELEIKQGSALSAQVGKAEGEKCARCWTYSREVGKNKQHADLCDRCIEAIQ